MPGRRQAGNMVGEQRPHAGARLHPGVPVVRRRVVFPQDVAEIVEAADMRGSGNVGEAEIVAGQPGAPLDRTSAVSGKRVSVRVYVAGCRIIKKKQTITPL